MFRHVHIEPSSGLAHNDGLSEKAETWRPILWACNTITNSSVKLNSILYVIFRAEGSTMQYLQLVASGPPTHQVILICNPGEASETNDHSIPPSPRVRIRGALPLRPALLRIGITQ